MKILFTGPVGSGKTTQAKMLAGKLGFVLIKTGELVREKAKENSDGGEIAKRAIESGELAPDDFTANLIREKLKSLQDEKGLVFDGYPRRLSEIKHYDPGIDLVVYIDISDEEAEKRLLNRHRMDDDPDTIEKRLEIYHRETNPMIDFYRKNGKLIEINGLGTEQEVQDRIIEYLGVFKL